MKIFVNADASPVQDIVISIAKEAHIPDILVKSFNHFSHNNDINGVQTIYVDPDPDAADYKIIQLAEQGDIIITQNYGLKSFGLAKGSEVLHNKGSRYTNKTINSRLRMRHISAKARRNDKQPKGPNPFTDQDRGSFQQFLINTDQ